jgi:hypothetical protein
LAWSCPPCSRKAEELLAALAGQSASREPDAHIEFAEAEHDLPRGVRAVIGCRISYLPEGAQELLQVASVLGQDFELDVLLQVAGQTETYVFAGLEAAVTHHLVEARQAGREERYAFAHALIAETLYHEVPPFRLSELALGRSEVRFIRA